MSQIPTDLYETNIFKDMTLFPGNDFYLFLVFQRLDAYRLNFIPTSINFTCHMIVTVI